MSCKLIDWMIPPRGGCWYKQPETGVSLDGQSVVGTIQKVLEHRRANGLARASYEEVSEDVQHQFCQRQPPSLKLCDGDCSAVGNEDIDRAQIKRGLEAFFAWGLAKLTGENPLVEQAEADRRAAICSKCFLNRGGDGCSNCDWGDYLREMIGVTVGERSTPFDGKLQACGVCGCLNRVQVWFKASILKKITPDDLQAKYNQVPHCWKQNLD